MQQLLLVLVGAIGVGLGLGMAFIVPDRIGGGARSAPQEVIAGEEAEAEEVVNDAIPEEAGEDLYKVVKVIDGDTVTLSMNGKNETLRLIGIDTPETNDSRVDVQCMGDEATAGLKAVIGERVAVELDASQGERDRYGRLLAYIYSEEGRFLNKYMVAEGLAHEYTYNEPYRYQKAFKDAEAAAKAAQKGLWNPNACPSAKTNTTINAAAAAAAAAPKPVPQSAPQRQPTATEAPPAQQLVEPAVEKSATPSAELQPTQEESQTPVSEPTPTPEPTPAPEPQPDTSGYTCSSNTYNCSDFKTHAEAQAVYEMCGGASNDVHRLDSNKDGEACESLP